jgi:hypothetical protein
MLKHYKIIIPVLWTIIFALSARAQDNKTGEDQFAKIGTRQTSTRVHLLEDKLPPVLPEKYLPEMHGKKSAFEPIDKMDTPEELQKAIALMEEKFLPSG